MAQILILDDEVSLSGLMVDSLRAHGHAVTIVTTAAEALEALRLTRFDALVVDIFLRDDAGQLRPDGGLTVVNSVRRGRDAQPMATPRDVRIVCISGAALLAGIGHVLTISRSLGADAVLDKPFSPKALFDALGLAYRSWALEVQGRRSAS